MWLNCTSLLPNTSSTYHEHLIFNLMTLSLICVTPNEIYDVMRNSEIVKCPKSHGNYPVTHK